VAKEPALGRAQNGEPMHYSVGAIIKNREGKYLLIDRKNPPFGMACIAGHIAEAETHIEALHREVYEESGFRVKKEKVMEERKELSNVCKSGMKIHCWYLFECECNGTPWRKEDEALSIAWYSQEEVQALANEGKLEPIWNFWLKRFNVILDSDKVQELKVQTVKEQPETELKEILPIDKRKGVCQEDDPEKRCDFFVLSSEGWVCEKATDLGEAIRERFVKEDKKPQDNC